VGYRLIDYNPVDILDAFGKDVKSGLTSEPKRLSFSYLYDEEGSRLFDLICELPEYYVARAEREILQDRAVEIRDRFPGEVALVELGNGSAAKTRILIEAFLSDRDSLCYAPIDISPVALEHSSQDLAQKYDSLEIIAVAGDFEQGLLRLSSIIDCPKLILFFGSSIGNLEPEEAVSLLKLIRKLMRHHDRLLVGIDLRKERAILEAAYNDARGITAQFNLNLLARINSELGGNFDLTRFRHRAVYNEEKGRIEMYLDSLCDQQVWIDRLGLMVNLREGEAIHTENSYKFSLSQIEDLAHKANLQVEHQWMDSEKRFSLNLLACI
jgi:dimethylhistidine N-methyltransferase